MKINTKKYFIEIIADDDHYITTYKDTEDIKNYSSSKIANCPLTTDTSVYREITAEEDATYNWLKELESEKENDNS
jgi:hypothetical protein